MNSATTIVAACGCKITRLPTEPSSGKSVHTDGRPIREVVVVRCLSCTTYNNQRIIAMKEAEKIILEDYGPKEKGTMSDKEFEKFCASWDGSFLQMTQDIWEAKYGKADP